MIDDACVLHHVVFVHLLLSRVIEFFLRNLAFNSVQKPFLHLFLVYINAGEFFVIYGSYQGIILLQAELHPYFDAKLRFDPDRSIDNLVFLVNTVMKILVAEVHESLT